MSSKKGCGCGTLIALAFVIAAGIYMASSFSSREADDATTSSALPTPSPTPDPFGGRPVFGDAGFGGIMVPSAMKRAIQERLRDPESFLPRKASMEAVTHEGVKCYRLTLLFSSKNGFGGMNEGVAIAYMRGSELLAITTEGL